MHGEMLEDVWVSGGHFGPPLDLKPRWQAPPEVVELDRRTLETVTADRIHNDAGAVVPSAVWLRTLRALIDGVLTPARYLLSNGVQS